jgi:hypothetical protein
MHFLQRMHVSQHIQIYVMPWFSLATKNETTNELCKTICQQLQNIHYKAKVKYNKSKIKK